MKKTFLVIALVSCSNKLDTLKTKMEADNIGDRTPLKRQGGKENLLNSSKGKTPSSPINSTPPTLSRSGGREDINKKMKSVPSSPEVKRDQLVSLKGEEEANRALKSEEKADILGSKTRGKPPLLRSSGQQKPPKQLFLAKTIDGEEVKIVTLKILKERESSAELQESLVAYFRILARVNAVGFVDEKIVPLDEFVNTYGSKKSKSSYEEAKDKAEDKLKRDLTSHISHLQQIGATLGITKEEIKELEDLIKEM